MPAEVKDAVLRGLSAMSAMWPAAAGCTLQGVCGHMEERRERRSAAAAVQMSAGSGASRPEIDKSRRSAVSFRSWGFGVQSAPGCMPCIVPRPGGFAHDRPVSSLNLQLGGATELVILNWCCSVCVCVCVRVKWRRVSLPQCTLSCIFRERFVLNLNE